jgi:hypothetical protein
MQNLLSIYPRLLVFTGVILAFLIAVALMPAPSDATTISTPVQTTASETTRKLGAGDCRLDQHAYAPTCTMQGRAVRVINF